jgi:hypothetical protein
MLQQHAFKGNGWTCETCGKTPLVHRARKEYDQKRGKRNGSFDRKAYDAKRDRKAYDAARPNRQSKRVIIGIDGEGHDLPDGSHIYTLLCAVDENGRLVHEVENQNGLSSAECFEFFLALPVNQLRFIFMGSYDWTKIIEGIDLTDRYYVMHPEARRKRVKGKGKTRLVLNMRQTKADGKTYGLDWFNGSFTVAVPGERKSKKRWNQQRKVWDCFKFFQCSFVQALKNWNVGTLEQWERIQAMKLKRGAFHLEDPEQVKAYCREECALLARMMREVIRACADADIKLTQYHGAGSIASALLKKHEVKKYIGPDITELPEGLRFAIMAAYFGGRFENSGVGAVTKPVYGRDIYSAYPYALSQLPCLSCGNWSHVDSYSPRMKTTLALVHFRVRPMSERERTGMPWAPLPFRDEKGSICFPTGFEGWAWLPELLPALEGWPSLIEVLDAWVYNTDCGHKPFAWIPGAYRKRFEWGKDGRGIVMKLGLNACAGKTMQNAGDPPPFKSWIWGGMTTATTRGQALGGICCASDRWNVLAIATDGVFSTEKTDMPQAVDTGTSDLEKPLGQWGCDVYENGVFFVKPGMYFNDATSLMRARGIGRGELKTYKQQLVDTFRAWDRHSQVCVKVQSRRFFGARSSVLMQSYCTLCSTHWPGPIENGCPKCRTIGNHYRVGCMKLPNGLTAYGRWFPREIEIEFACFPKRERISRAGNFGRMRIRDMGGAQSRPYRPGMTTPEGIAQREANEQALEEPDWLDEDS